MTWGGWQPLQSPQANTKTTTAATLTELAVVALSRLFICDGWGHSQALQLGEAVKEPLQTRQILQRVAAKRPERFRVQGGRR